MSGWQIGRKRDNVHGTKGVSGPSPDAPGMWTRDSRRTRGAPRCTAAGRSSPGGNLSPGQSAGTSSCLRCGPTQAPGTRQPPSPGRLRDGLVRDLPGRPRRSQPRSPEIDPDRARPTVAPAAVRSQASGSPGSGEAREIRISSPSIRMVTLSSSANGNAESPATLAGILTNRVLAGPCLRILPSPTVPIQSILHSNVFILIRCSM
jgi:hypothetical protein